MKEQYNLRKEDNLLVTEIPSGSGANFGFKKWTWGEKNAMTSECTIIDPLRGFVTIDSEKYNALLVAKTVFKKVEDKYVPFTIEEVKALDAQLGERLFRITQTINLVSEVEARNL